jgi:hypothetical protein
MFVCLSDVAYRKRGRANNAVVFVKTDTQNTTEDTQVISKLFALGKDKVSRMLERTMHVIGSSRIANLL